MMEKTLFEFELKIILTVSSLLNPVVLKVKQAFV